MTGNKQQELDRLQNYRKSVRVFGIRKGKFLEFDYTLGSAELTIELVMPYPVFKEFCEINHVAKIACDPEVEVAFTTLVQGRLPKNFDKKNIIQLGDFT